MKVLITSGGTSEQIDNVRSITNTSTGKLGCLIAEAFASRSETLEIDYICSRKAVFPQNEKTSIFYVDDVASLESAVRNILNQKEIDIIIHCMAVSDYRVRSVTCASMVAEWIKDQGALQKSEDMHDLSQTVSGWLKSAGSVINQSGKISSSINDMILLMERTPKIISLFQSLSPKSVLVGFKLLDHAPHDTLIEAAYHVLQDNKCSFVLANDLADVSEDRHIGYLMDEEKNYTEYKTKKEIADAIVCAALQKSRRGI